MSVALWLISLYIEKRVSGDDGYGEVFVFLIDFLFVFFPLFQILYWQ